MAQIVHMKKGQKPTYEPIDQAAVDAATAARLDAFVDSAEANAPVDPDAPSLDVRKVPAKPRKNSKKK